VSALLEPACKPVLEPCALPPLLVEGWVHGVSPASSTNSLINM
jgi:hypothetical protein